MSELRSIKTVMTARFWSKIWALLWTNCVLDVSTEVRHAESIISSKDHVSNGKYLVRNLRRKHKPFFHADFGQIQMSP